jgi:hypothetical protein
MEKGWGMADKGLGDNKVDISVRELQRRVEVIMRPYRMRECKECGGRFEDERPEVTTCDPCWQRLMTMLVEDQPIAPSMDRPITGITGGEWDRFMHPEGWGDNGEDEYDHDREEEN